MSNTIRFSSHDRTNDIVSSAVDLFLRSTTSLSLESLDHGELMVYDEELKLFIDKTILDSGMIYLTTPDDVQEVWAGLVDDYDNVDLKRKLISLSLQWRTLNFVNIVEYNKWVQQLCESYCATDAKSSEYNHGAVDPIDPDNIIIDDDTLDRLPIRSEYQPMLSATPWLTFLLTLNLAESWLTQRFSIVKEE